MTERGRLLERETANERRDDAAAATPCECPSYYEVEALIQPPLVCGWRQ
jgi:hypothetical protein